MWTCSCDTRFSFFFFSPFDEHKEEINKILNSIKDNSNYVTDAFHKFIPEIHIPSHIVRIFMSLLLFSWTLR